MTPTADLLLSDLVDENEALRAELAGWRTDIEILKDLLSVALERVHTLTVRCNEQTDHIRRLMGIHDDELRAMME